MLSMAVILAVFSVGIEMILVTTYEKVRLFMLKHEKLGLFLSFFLSYGMGTMFGAHGVIALFAGVMSTVITVAIYKLHLLHLIDTYRVHQDEISAKLTSTWDVTRKSIIFWWKVFTTPIRFIAWIKRTIKHAYAKIKGIHLPSFRRVPT